ncbi:M28 family metallopeptidase [Thermoplasmatota archaeon]
MKNNIFHKSSNIFLSIILFLLLININVITPASLLNENNQKYNMQLNQNIGNNNINYNKITNILNDINENDIKTNLEILTSEYTGRVTGSEICENAGDWIYNEFSTSDNLKVKKIPWTERSNYLYRFKEYSCMNVEAELTGKSNSNDIFIFCAHYDTDQIDSPGALDNGASIAAMLTIAQAMDKHEFNNTIKFIAFSGEELFFLGSRSYAKTAYNNGDNIIGVLNADVIANNSYRTDKPNQLRAFSTQSIRWIVDIMNKASNDFEIGIDVESRLYYGHSDDKSFDDYGYSAMQIYQASNAMEHFFGRANDTLDLINFSYLTKMAKCIAASLAVLGDYNINPDIKINSPLEDKLYYRNGTKIIDLDNGRTVLFGNAIIKAEILRNNVTKVIFELIEDYNEYIDSSHERKILATFIDETYPYIWNFNEKILGRNTVRVTAYSSEDKYFIDEIEIFFVCI